MADTHPPESPDALLRRSLNAGARAALERRLGAAAAEDAALARLLARLPDRPVASNFNARVLALLDRPEAAPVPAPWWQALLRPRVAAAAGAVLAAALAFGAWQQHARRVQAGTYRPIAALGELELLSPAVLQDFEAIQRFAGGPAAGVDFELLESLQ